LSEAKRWDEPILSKHRYRVNLILRDFLDARLFTGDLEQDGDNTLSAGKVLHDAGIAVDLHS
jgi:hypothetical protein